MLDAGPPRDDTFPKLSEKHRARIASFAKERAFKDGELLWEQGDRDRPLYLVLEGGIEILSGTDDHRVVVHQQDEFSGDVDLLSGRPVVVKGRAVGATRVLELPAEKLRTVIQTDAELSEILLRAFLLRRIALQAQGSGSVVLIGSPHSAGTLELQEFLTRNGLPYAYLDVEKEPDIQKTLDGFNVGIDDVPVFICRGRKVFKKPTIEEVAECLGLNRVETGAVHDVAIVGAGPGGLAAAVYAASEGLDTVVLEAGAPGGQAGSSSRIENYLGFPTGITGQELTSRAFVQAEKFGASIAVARSAVRLGCERRPYQLELADGARILARTVILATGVKYRKPDLENLARYEGTGVYYGATQIEAKTCGDDAVIVVGGGNSAGQAAVFLSGEGRSVDVLVRGDSLAASMSKYLIRRIEQTPSITLRTHTEIVALEGGERLERVTWRNTATGERATVEICHVFLMTGAVPNTAWLKECVTLDEKAFVKTGQDLTTAELSAAKWPLARQPLLFETSLPGVFAVGDARASSVKRVAAAVGEGAVCVQLVHRVLSE
jgi:thioredoxin reductase (NADPH)